MSMSVERQRALWLLSGRESGWQTSRFCDWPWLAACPPCMGRGTYSQSIRGGPARLLQEYPTPLGRRMAGRAALFRGHPTDMAPQPYWHIGRLYAAKPCPRRTLLQRLLSAHTYQPSPPSTALPHPPLPLLQLLPIPRRPSRRPLHFCSSQKDAFALGLTPCESTTPAAVPLVPSLGTSPPSLDCRIEQSTPPLLRLHRYFCYKYPTSPASPPWTTRSKWTSIALPPPSPSTASRPPSPSTTTSP